MQHYEDVVIIKHHINKIKEMMFIINLFSGYPSSSSTCQDSQDQENSTLRKVATCIPGLGLVIGGMQSASLEKKFKKLPLPEELRPSPQAGNILKKNASPKEKKAACERAIQLMSIDRDYTKAALVNNILTIALVVYALAVNVIPLVVAGILIGGFSLTAAMLTFVLYSDRSIKRYEKLSASWS